MSTRQAQLAPVGFQRPEIAFADLDAAGAASMIAATADIALILDPSGIIVDVSFGQPDLAQEDRLGWMGRAWQDVVTVESKPKVDQLIATVQAGGVNKWRQINHATPGAEDIPVLYNAVPLNGSGMVLAVGRDLRSLAALQQSLMDAQQAMERDYSKLREVEARYRQLFHLAGEAVMVVDASSLQVQEANPAAVKLIGKDQKKIVGRTVSSALGVDKTSSLDRMLATARSTGTAQEDLALSDGREISCLTSLFRQNRSTLFLLRLSGSAGDDGAEIADAGMLQVIENAPEAFVVTDLEGRILTCNEAFLGLAQVATPDLAAGEPLDRWLSRPGTSFATFASNLKTHGAIRSLPMVMADEYDGRNTVDVSAVAVLQGNPPCFGFVIRPESPKLDDSGTTEDSPLGRSVDQITELVGQVPLKDLVRETTDVIERMCIEAALKLTNNNRANAAEILGLSRQSLYVKLRRFNLDGGDDDAS